MLDVLIRGGRIADGTGRPCYEGSVGIRGRRLVLNPTDQSAHQVIDADGLVVAPGFVDLHTHYDVQLLWDPTASPSLLNGVTTVFGGNCGFTLAPLREETADYLIRMMAVVEGMPLVSLQTGTDWRWRAFEEWMDRLDGRISVNAGFLVGHSAIRLAVMGPDAVGKAASDDQVAEMAKLLSDCLAVGGLGFSSTQKSVHLDADGDHVPSFFATKEELLALSSVLRSHDGTNLVFAAEGLGLKRHPAEDIALMTEMSRAAGRPVNWNTIRLTPDDPEFVEAQLSAYDYSRAHGGMIVGLTNPKPFRPRVSFASGMPFNGLPGWAGVFGKDLEGRKVDLMNPEIRRELRKAEHAQLRESQRPLMKWAGYEIAQGFTPEVKKLEGQIIGDLAQAEGRDPYDVLLDLVVRDELRTQFLVPEGDNSLEAWQFRKNVWLDPRTVIGGSDAGAHMDQMVGGNYPTTLLGEHVRKRQLLSIEEAVHQLTAVPARFYGLKERGQIADGWWADLVIFDPETVSPGVEREVTDLPGGGARLYSEPTGIEHVFVNGTEVVRGGKALDACPGRLLKSGRDTTNLIQV